MKKIKILTITLGIVAITMIAFFGIYTQVQNRMENQLKDYSYAMDLKGSRNIRLTVNEEESEEVKNVENYRASQKVIEKRLKKLGVDNYIIKVDEQTGDIVIELTENDTTDSIISNINTTGKFKIVDTETEEVLMDNSDIKLAQVLYGSSSSTTSSGTSVYLDIEFTKEGTEKLEKISNEYIKTEDTTSTEETEEENSSGEDTTTEKTITMKIDDEEIMTTSFDEPIQTGKLQLSIGSSTTDTDTLQGYIEQASSMAIVLDTGNIPVQYDLEENQYILSDITNNQIQIAIYIVLAIIVIGLIVLIVKYKTLGALGAISYIGFVSLLMIVDRYIDIVFSLEGLFGMIIIFLLNYILVNKLLTKVNKPIEVYKRFFIKILPVIILVIAFCFAGWTPISSFGMVMLWGIIFIAVYNAIVTNGLLKIKEGKEA